MRVIKHIITEIRVWLRVIVFAIPGKTGQLLRVIWCYQNMRKWGSSSRVGSNVIFLNPRNIKFGHHCEIGQYGFFSAEGGEIRIGNSVKFNHNVHINASVSGKIFIHDNCLIGPNVVMRTSDHMFLDESKLIQEQGHASENIIIEEDVWIASNVIILKGVNVAKGCIIAAGSVLNQSTEPMGVYAGIPAKRIKNRGEKK